MAVVRHVFHTRHDFTPEFAWAAFQLLAGIGAAGLEMPELYAVAEGTASPLIKRADFSKLLGAMDQLGLTERTYEHVSLSSAGETLAKSLGRYQAGFNVAIHCLYSWTWLWDGAGNASPSWSYREVCRQLLDSGATGIEGDELVLRVVSAAAKLFRAEKISFSRSSVAGITMWLEAQLPSLVQRIGSRIFTHTTSGPMADALRLNLIALCAYNGGEATLNSQGRQLLAECFLISGDELMGHVTEFARVSNEFLLIPSTPYKLVFTQSEDPFINWMIAKRPRLAGESS
jgi:hypothetical protein